MSVRRQPGHEAPFDLPLPPPPDESVERRAQYWRHTRRLTLAMLVLWFFVTFVLGYFARDLNFSFFGWPFSFWVASQGALIVYGLIVWGHAWLMRRLDQRFRKPVDPA